MAVNFRKNKDSSPFPFQARLAFVHDLSYNGDARSDYLLRYVADLFAMARYARGYPIFFLILPAVFRSATIFSEWNGKYFIPVYE